MLILVGPFSVKAYFSVARSLQVPNNTRAARYSNQTDSSHLMRLIFWLAQQIILDVWAWRCNSWQCVKQLHQAGLVHVFSLVYQRLFPNFIL